MNNRVALIAILGFISVNALIAFQFLGMDSGEKQSLESSTEAAEEEKIDWKLVQGEGVIEIDSPRDWGLIWGHGHFGFTQPGADSYVWSIDSVTSAGVSRQIQVDKIGENYADREITQEEIEINGMSATKVTVTSATNPNLKQTSILVDGEEGGRPGMLFVISDEGNNLPGFEHFYNSFKVAEPIVNGLRPDWVDEILEETEKTEAVLARNAVPETLVEEIPYVPVPTEIPKPKSTKASAAYTIEHATGNIFYVRGTLSGLDGCYGPHQQQFVFDPGNGQVATTMDCREKSFAIAVEYEQRFIPYYPVLTVRYVNANNVWENSEQGRFEVNTNNPNQPAIRRLSGNAPVASQLPTYSASPPEAPASSQDPIISGSNASIKQMLGNTRSQAEIYYNQNGFTYLGACANSQMDALIKAVKEVLVGQNAPSTKVSCNDSSTEYFVQAPLIQDGASSPEYWCIDSTGFAGVIKNLQSSTALACE